MILLLLIDLPIHEPTFREHSLGPQKAPVGKVFWKCTSTFKDDTSDIILQPETRPISQEQLVAMVEGTYTSLVMVEAKCIEVDNKQARLPRWTSTQ